MKRTLRQMLKVSFLIPKLHGRCHLEKYLEKDNFLNGCPDIISTIFITELHCFLFDDQVQGPNFQLSAFPC